MPIPSKRRKTDDTVEETVTAQVSQDFGSQAPMEPAPSLSTNALSTSGSSDDVATSESMVPIHKPKLLWEVSYKYADFLMNNSMIPPTGRRCRGGSRI